MELSDVQNQGYASSSPLHIINIYICIYIGGGKHDVFDESMVALEVDFRVGETRRSNGL